MSPDNKEFMVHPRSASPKHEESQPLENKQVRKEKPIQISILYSNMYCGDEGMQTQAL
jgi:hypothetical protein